MMQVCGRALASLVAHQASRNAARTLCKSKASSPHGLNITLNVRPFTVSELTVKIENVNSIVVEGQCAVAPERYRLIAGNFARRYVLPRGHRFDNVSSKLSVDGVLNINAETKPMDASIALKKSVIYVPIEHEADESTINITPLKKTESGLLSQIKIQ